MQVSGCPTTPVFLSTTSTGFFSADTTESSLSGGEWGSAGELAVKIFYF